MWKENLIGHSGCDIHLYQNEDGTQFVRKTSKDIAYNKRLEVQCLKQSRYRHPRIKTPLVLDQGYDENGLFYFDMEYVKGVALNQYIKTIEAYRIKDFISNLVDDLLSSESVANGYANNIFHDKIAILRQQILTDMEDDHIIETALNILDNFDWSDFEMAKCHGDLTMENIIVKGEQIYLIDFLDSFYDSVYIDLGKLLQDVIALWSFRNDKNISSNTLIRLKIFKDLLIEKISNNKKILLNIYHALLLHLVRILPYTKDNFTRDYVISKIKLTIDLIAVE